MVTTYEEFKLRVLKKVTDLHSKDQTPFPLLCFQDGEGKNRLIRLPSEVFETKNYKEYLPDNDSESQLSILDVFSLMK